MIKEISRYSQASDKGLEIIAKVSADYGIRSEAIASEISTKINDMDVSLAARSAGWYAEANAFASELAAKHNVSLKIAAGVISAVSPRMPWLRNKNVADAILGQFRNFSSLSAMDAAKEIGLALSTNVAMAVTIARGADIEIALTGTKRRSFYNNIVSPLSGDSVTIDTWMIQAFCNVTGNDKKTGEKFVKANNKALNGTGVGYFVIAEAVRIVAKQMNLIPSQIQALYWVSVTNNFDGGRTDVQ